MPCNAPSVYHEACPRDTLGESETCYLHQDDALDREEFREALNDDLNRINQDAPEVADFSYGNFPSLILHGETFPNLPLLLNNSTFQGRMTFRAFNVPRMDLSGSDCQRLLILRSQTPSLSLTGIDAHHRIDIAGCQIGELEGQGCRAKGRISLSYSVFRDVYLNGVEETNRVEMDNCICSEIAFNGSEIETLAIRKVTALSSITASPLPEAHRLVLQNVRTPVCHLREMQVPEVFIVDSHIGSVHSPEATFTKATFRNLRVEVLDLHGCDLLDDVTIEDVLLEWPVEIQPHARAMAIQPHVGQVQTPEFPEEWMPEDRELPAPQDIDGQEVDHDEILDAGLIVNRKCRPVMALHGMNIPPSGSLTFGGHLHSINMGRVLLLRTDLEQVDFQNVLWPRRNGRRTTTEALSLHRAVSTGPRADRQRGFFHQAKDRPQIANHPWLRLRLLGWLPVSGTLVSEVSAQMRSLRMSLEDAYRYQDAGDFFVEEMDLRRLGTSLTPDVSVRERVEDWILGGYRKVSLYGESYLRVGVSFLAFGLLSALLLPDYTLDTTMSETMLAALWATKESLLAMLSIDVSGVREELIRLVGLFHLALIAIGLRRRLMRYSTLNR